MGKPWPPVWLPPQTSALIWRHPRIRPAGIASLLQSYGLPTAISASEQDYRDTLVKDKKSQGSNINLIALTEIGHAQPVNMPQSRLLELVKECRL